MCARRTDMEKSNLANKCLYRLIANWIRTQLVCARQRINVTILIRADLLFTGRRISTEFRVPFINSLLLLFHHQFNGECQMRQKAECFLFSLNAGLHIWFIKFPRSDIPNQKLRLPAHVIKIRSALSMPHCGECESRAALLDSQLGK